MVPYVTASAQFVVVVYVTYPIGNGAASNGTFNLPNFAGKFPIGAGTGQQDNSTTLTVAQLQLQLQLQVQPQLRLQPTNNCQLRQKLVLTKSVQDLVWQAVLLVRWEVLTLSP